MRSGGSALASAGPSFSDLLDDDDAESSADESRFICDYESSMAIEQEKRRKAFSAQLERIRKEGNLTEAPGPDSHRGSPRPVRDLDDLNHLTGEPKFYPKILWAARAIGVGRAHNIINAIARNGRCVGHRFITDEQYWRSCMSLQKRLESKIKARQAELKIMEQLNEFLTNPAASELLIELEVDAPKVKPRAERAGKRGGKAEEVQAVGDA